MEKILIIEDDLGISNSLKLYLENSNFIALQCYSWDKAIDMIKQNNPDLIILDINLPGKDGIQICKELREFSKIPVVMLTARDSEYDRITGLEIWADDYIAKPFSPRELLARIKVILKRIKDKNEEENVLTYKNLKLFLDKKLVFIDDKKLDLTKNEYDLLKKFLETDGNIVSREVLMTEVLGYEKYIYDRTVDTHIKNLRKKLVSMWDVILTVRWEGYRLNK